MGCGASAKYAAKEQQAIIESTVTDLSKVEAPSMVRVVGRVVDFGTIMQSPFGQVKGVAMKVRTDINGGSVSDRKHLFTAKQVVDFQLSDGNKEVLIKGGDWRLELKQSHYEKNIFRDEKCNVRRTSALGDQASVGLPIISGGADWGKRDKLTEKPDAAAWWAKFNGGVDTFEPSAVTQLPRGAREFVLTVGELAAVVGRLEQSGDQLQIVPQTLAAEKPSSGESLPSITNEPKATEDFVPVKPTESKMVQVWPPLPNKEAKIIPMHQG